jgi:Rrf2 family transcriptional regulator, iron-sulfur cluster assembly transcription factor
MRLTTKGRFAVTAMLDLALSAKTSPMTLSAIAERQRISLSYLEQLFAKLRRAELVESVRGPGGGYFLGRSAAEISVADIIIAVEEQMDSRQCEGRENCRRQVNGTDKSSGETARESSGRCMTHDLWESLNENVIQFLSGVTLDDLVQKQHARSANAAANPVVLHGALASVSGKPTESRVAA